MTTYLKTMTLNLGDTKNSSNNVCYLRSPCLFLYNGSSNWAVGRHFNTFRKYGRSLSWCWRPLWRKYSPSAIVASWLRGVTTSGEVACGHSINKVFTYNNILLFNIISWLYMQIQYYKIMTLKQKLLYCMYNEYDNKYIFRQE